MQKVCRDVGLTVQPCLWYGALCSQGRVFPDRTGGGCFRQDYPGPKEQIVRELRERPCGRVHGDGVNDAPASKQPMGISVDSAVDVAKEAADIKLGRKPCAQEGIIEEGRPRKYQYIRMAQADL